MKPVSRWLAPVLFALTTFSPFWPIFAAPPESEVAGASLPMRNMSARTRVSNGEGVAIAGFIVRGSAPQNVILRALGPSLQVGREPLPGRLADPTLELYAEGSSRPIATNDNWQDTQAAAIQATGIPPGNRLEAAIRVTLDPGQYTAIVRGRNGGSGLALVEVYDLDNLSDRRLVNLSTRGVVGRDDDVLIAGIIVAPGEPNGLIQVVFRGLGPSLAAAGIAASLADPTLQLLDANGMLVAANDDWADDARLELQRTGLTPTDSRESAFIMSLTAGNYTAIVSGKNSTTGVGLVEVYDVPQRPTD